MGAYDKGKKRDTSMTNRQILANRITDPLLTSSTRFTLIHFLTIFFPQLAPLIYAAYLVYKISERAIFAYRQYLILRRTMSEQRALLIASGLWALREGMIYVTKQFKVDEISNKLYPLIVSFVATGKLSEVTLEMVRKDRKKDDKLQYMLQATLSQFVIGATIGSEDPLIQEAAKLLV